MNTTLLHCSYHKCLTVYYAKTMRALHSYARWWGRPYRHFKSRLDDFYADHARYRVASVNNHALDLERLGDRLRLTRFVRDPRDLVVSGYFYHRKGVEAWSRVVDAREEDWVAVNGCLPSGMRPGHSMSSFLQSVDPEDGLIAEIEFRRRHFESMRAWPEEDARIRLFRYEDLVGNEQAVFAEIFRFYGLPAWERWLGGVFANHFSSRKMASRTKHIRNPRSGQWREHFTPRVEAYFMERYEDLLQRHGYGDPPTAPRGDAR